MEKKIQKHLIDHWCGFPVLLLNVPMIKVMGDWAPHINYNDYMRDVLRLLAHKPRRLTGAQIRFIRDYFQMTFQEFATRFGVSHAAVIKWEKTRHAPTSMAWGTEKDIRLSILTKLKVRPQEIVKLYSELEIVPEKTPSPIQLDMAA